jgi:UDP-N-acetylglucosamine--N-acetylmuramyl-(pentapeptide) pyrophosphoryl-undecaprenol N-acetylglucosamine transferase
VAEQAPLFALIAGGGSGGHVIPGLAVADALVRRGHPQATVAFLGTSRGLEATLVPAAGYETVLYRMRSFPRRLTVGHVAAMGELMRAVVRSVGMLRRRRPRVVVSVGGYASIPGVVAAVLTRTPIVAVSYDALPGRSSLIAARVAKASAVAFADSPLPRKVVTGAAIREEVLAVDRVAGRAAARERLGVPEGRLLLVVVGGSQGSGALNAVIDAFVLANRLRRDVAVRHVVGARNDDGQRQSLDGSDGLLYQVVGYEGDMASVYAGGDVLLARSGATTVFEIAAVGMASILVPWPNAAEDHQTANARVLSDRNGAILIHEAEFSVDRLQKELDRLADPELRQAIASAANGVGHRDGADRIAVVVEDCAAS